MQSTRQPGKSELLEGLSRHLVPMRGDAHDYEALLQLIGPARFALLGEASHGTREFYRERIDITRRLITEKGAVVVPAQAGIQCPLSWTLAGHLGWPGRRPGRGALRSRSRASSHGHERFCINLDQ